MVNGHPNLNTDLSTNIEIAFSLNPELMHQISIFLHNVLKRGELLVFEKSKYHTNLDILGRFSLLTRQSRQSREE